jgi:hypothetical protein
MKTLERSPSRGSLLPERNPVGMSRSRSSEKLATLSRSRSSERLVISRSGILSARGSPDPASSRGPSERAPSRGGVGELLEARNRELQQMAGKLNDALHQSSKLETEVTTLTAKNKVIIYHSLHLLNSRKAYSLLLFASLGIGKSGRAMPYCSRRTRSAKRDTYYGSQASLRQTAPLYLP